MMWLCEYDPKGVFHEEGQITREHTAYKGQLIFIVLAIFCVFHNLPYDCMFVFSLDALLNHSKRSSIRLTSKSKSFQNLPALVGRRAIAVGHQCGPLFLERRKSAVNYSNADVRVGAPARAGASVSKVTFRVRSSALAQKAARIRSEFALTYSIF